MVDFKAFVEAATAMAREKYGHETSVACELVVWNYSYLSSAPTVQFSIWDGHTHHRGDSPEAALEEMRRVYRIVLPEPTDIGSLAEVTVPVSAEAQVREEAA